ncbi:hypothetical protein PSQ19_06405 [Devosia algicola]|uniref:Transglycosylase SLT domain-containing protein n=1 Tax=Devosia algicola TaxID=3026418 RepID=A0ABY7YR08_9HYPH|nr:hypothetical protein [Devosia algicola]WDR03691.1 hypothetical protein PSQ19_06405 [Devosia algicola]
MHYNVGRAISLSNDSAEFERNNGRPVWTGIDVNAGWREAVGGDCPVESELVEDVAGIGTDLQACAKFGNRAVAFQYYNAGAKFGQRQRQRQSSDARAGNVKCPANG